MNFKCIAFIAFPSILLSGCSNNSQTKSPEIIRSTLDVSPVFNYVIEQDKLPVNNQKIEYPVESKKAKEEGKVMLIARIDADGKVENLKILESSGYPRLDQAAIDGAKNWTFIPARKGIMSVSSNVIIPIQFVIKTEQKSEDAEEKN